MTAFTLLHTLLSILPVGFGLAAYIRHRAIDPKTAMGKWYIGTMLIGTLTGFGFLFTIGFTPGQVLGLLTLGLVALGTLTFKGKWRPAGYAQTVALSASYLMLWVFLTTETLKRVPFDRPFASGPTDPSLLPVRLGLLAIFLAGVTYQVVSIRRSRKAQQQVLPSVQHAA